MDKTITIKNKSIRGFIMDNLAGSDRLYDERQNLYHFMRDEIVLKNETIKDGYRVIFILDDVSKGSDRKLSNIYTYDAYTYDDISVILKLIDFKIEIA